jgi:hypothetical protein
MKPKRFSLAAIAILLSSAGLIFASRIAYAYPAGTGELPSSSDTVTAGTSLQTLIAPFENFFESLLGSIGTQPIVGGTIDAQGPVDPGFNFSNIQNTNPQQLLQEVDQWFMNLNPTEVITAVLNGILWVLWLTQQFVQWLLSLVH